MTATQLVSAVLKGSTAPAAADETCRWGDVKCSIGKGLEGAGEKFFGWMVDRTVDGITSMLEVMSVAWFDWPSPTLASRPEIWDETGLSPTLLKMHDALAVPIYLIACVSFLFAIIQMVWTMRAQELQAVLRMFVILLSSTVTAAVVVQALLEAGDAFAPWVVRTAAGEEYNSTAFQTLVIGFGGDAAMPLSLIVVTLIMALFMILGTIAQVAFMILRAPLILTMMVFLPLVAAGTATTEGMQRFKKMVAFLLAAVLYKPAAAVIYATGILLMRTSDEAEGVEQLLNLLYGTIIIVLAALALPALIKFFMPSAAVGSSNLFSGGAVGLAAGAVVVGGAMLASAGGAGGAAASTAGRAGGSAAPPPSGPPHQFPALGPGGGGGGSSGGSSAPPPSGGGVSGGDGQGGTGGAAGASSIGPESSSGARDQTSSPNGSAMPHESASSGAAASLQGVPASSAGTTSFTGGSGTPGAGQSGPPASEGSPPKVASGGPSGGPSGRGPEIAAIPSGGNFARAGRGSTSPRAAAPATSHPPLLTSQGVVMGAQPTPVGPQPRDARPGRRMGARVLGESGTRGWNAVAGGAGVNNQEAEGAPAVPVK